MKRKPSYNKHTPGGEKLHPFVNLPRVYMSFGVFTVQEESCSGYSVPRQNPVRARKAQFRLLI
jgi:hypothetical protein